MRITDTMEAFLAGETSAFLDECSAHLAEQWASFEPGELATSFALLWKARKEGWLLSSEELLTTLIGHYGTFDHCRLERLDFFAGTGGSLSRSFRATVLIECELARLDLRKSQFSGAWLESVSFAEADLSGVDFSSASLLDVDFTDSLLAGADFRTLEPGLSLRVSGVEYSKERAMGLLASRGALVASVDPLYIAMAHPHYDIARKIARRLCEGGASQHMGLTQRGASAKDPQAAIRFIEMLVSVGYAAYDKSGSERTVELAVAGRMPLRQLVDETGLAPALVGYFAKTDRR
ncbi:hypothetical protein EXU48_19360 [Occultella glacieicola]|uniref:Pentapeptide repeat-containing protein n=1 Tax=Occultella glacieicola TaxID=2518684 RepID=A0ABY2E0N3_9MICO|nr:pentapeptide repeat-containing protein [Occultella glacieicola]TDE90074.1 hypothetical protein EXU48_19360 [Occultella glacieicola]